jgi:hypothetical protein
VSKFLVSDNVEYIADYTNLAMSHFDFPAVEAATSLLTSPTLAKSPFGDCRTPRRWGFANVAAISIAGFGQM